MTPELERLLSTVEDHLKALENKDAELTNRLIQLAEKYGEVGEKLNKFESVINNSFRKKAWFVNPDNYYRIAVLICLILITLLGGQLKFGDFEFTLRQGVIKSIPNSSVNTQPLP